MQRKIYSIKFTEHNKSFCFSLHYNGENSYLFVNGKEIRIFKSKDSEIVATPLCLGNISKDWTVDNIKQLDLMTMFMTSVFIIIKFLLLVITNS